MARPKRGSTLLELDADGKAHERSTTATKEADVIDLT